MVPQRINEMQKLMPVLRAMEVLEKLCFDTGSITLAVFLNRGIRWNDLVHLKKKNDLLIFNYLYNAVLVVVKLMIQTLLFTSMKSCDTRKYISPKLET